MFMLTSTHEAIVAEIREQLRQMENRLKESVGNTNFIINSLEARIAEAEKRAAAERTRAELLQSEILKLNRVAPLPTSVALNTPRPQMTAPGEQDLLKIMEKVGGEIGKDPLETERTSAETAGRN